MQILSGKFEFSEEKALLSVPTKNLCVKRLFSREAAKPRSFGTTDEHGITRIFFTAKFFLRLRVLARESIREYLCLFVVSSFSRRERSRAVSVSQECGINARERGGERFCRCNQRKHQMRGGNVFHIVKISGVGDDVFPSQ